MPAFKKGRPLPFYPPIFACARLNLPDSFSAQAALHRRKDQRLLPHLRVLPGHHLHGHSAGAPRRRCPRSRCVILDSIGVHRTDFHSALAGRPRLFGVMGSLCSIPAPHADGHCSCHLAASSGARAHLRRHHVGHDRPALHHRAARIVSCAAGDANFSGKLGWMKEDACISAGVFNAMLTLTCAHVTCRYWLFLFLVTVTAVSICYLAAALCGVFFITNLIGALPSILFENFSL